MIQLSEELGFQLEMVVDLVIVLRLRGLEDFHRHRNAQGLMQTPENETGGALSQLLRQQTFAQNRAHLDARSRAALDGLRSARAVCGTGGAGGTLEEEDGRLLVLGLRDHRLCPR